LQALRALLGVAFCRWGFMVEKTSRTQPTLVLPDGRSTREVSVSAPRATAKDAPRGRTFPSTRAA
jgi:hypothetical protein